MKIDDILNLPIDKLKKMSSKDLSKLPLEDICRLPYELQDGIFCNLISDYYKGGLNEAYRINACMNRFETVTNHLNRSSANSYMRKIGIEDELVIGNPFYEFDYEEELTEQGIEILEDFQNLKLLTKGFYPVYLYEILKSSDKLYYECERASVYDPDVALSNALDLLNNRISKLFRAKLHPQIYGRTLIISISPNFIGVTKLLNDYKDIVRDYIPNDPNINIVVGVDSFRFGDTDLEIRFLLYR